MNSRADFREEHYSASVIVALVQILEERGFPAHRVLEGTSLSPEDLFSPATISTMDFIRVHSNAIALASEPSFGFQVGLRCHLSSYGIFGFAVLSSSSFRQAVNLVLDYGQIVEPSIEQKFVEFDDRKMAVITMDPLPGPNISSGLYQFFVDRYMGQIIAAFRDVIGSSFSPTSLAFAYSRDLVGKHSHINLEGCDIVYGAADNRLHFDASWLDRPVELGNSVTHAALVDLCRVTFEEFDARLGCSGRVRAFLSENLGRRVSLADACAQLGVSSRTLRRRLAEEGTSYAEILDDLRSRMALKYLRDSSLKVSVIAEALGFSDTATFRRALFRWTNKTPRQIRIEG